MDRRTLFTVGLVAAAAPLAGCGGGTAHKIAETIDPVAQAAEVTAQQEGGIAMTLHGDMTVVGQHATFDGDGVVDGKAKRGTMTMHVKVAGQDVSIETVIDKFVVYLRSDLFTGKLPGGKSWMKVDAGAAAAKEGIDLDALAGMGGGTGGDPSQALEYLKGAGASKDLGTEQVAGETTRHYHVDADLRKVAAKDPQAKSSVDKLIQQQGTAIMPIDVWIDGKHLVRREQFKVTQKVDGHDTVVDTTIDLTKYGVPVEVDVPSSDDVIDATQLADGLAG